MYFTERYLEVDLELGHRIGLVDLVGQGGDVFARVGLASDVEVVLLELGEKGEELDHGVVEVISDANLVRHVAGILLRETEACKKKKAFSNFENVLV